VYFRNRGRQFRELLKGFRRRGPVASGHGPFGIGGVSFERSFTSRLRAQTSCD
jgi:hypothetical protein